MAEARSIVKFSRPHLHSTDYLNETKRYVKSHIWHESSHTNSELALGLAKSLLVVLKSRLRRVQRYFTNALFPSTRFTWYISMTSVAASEYFNPGTSLWIASRLGIPHSTPMSWPQRVVTLFMTATVSWVLYVYFTRSALRWLLRYHGFLYEKPKTVSWSTKLWLVSVRLLEGFGKPLTYSFQTFLPRLPVPPLKKTIQRYLQSMKPLLDEAEFDRMQRVAEEFLNNEGPSLQRYVWAKSWMSTNYVSDWWEQFVYLRSRSALCVNSNFYIMDAWAWRPTPNQIARAANLLHHFMVYKKQLDRGEIKPLLIHNAVPLCMDQYHRTFGTARKPGIEQDTIQHVASKHVAVLCNGHFYVFDIFGTNGVLLSPRHIEAQLEEIMADSLEAPEPTFTERHLATMTATDRTRWAEFRQSHVNDRLSRASLDAIERAAIFLCLDDSSPECPEDTVTSRNPAAESLLCGNGSNIWFDKSINLIVHKNGRAGINAEHSWADAPVAAYAWETALALEFASPGYDHSSGKNKAVPYPKVTFKQPLRLRWHFDEKMTQPIVKKTLTEVQASIEDLDLRVLVHDDYAKGFIKKCKMSPDAWFQMALQLAYYRDQGHFTQTYEASMTRLFRNGRTETVRPVTEQSCAFVLALEAGKPKEEIIKLLRAAANVHVGLFRDAMAGKGVDRHLFALYVISMWKGVESTFLNEALSVGWQLSTSQTPAQQTTLFDLGNNLDKISAGGGFGPVADDGYGVSYIISSDQTVCFHVSSKHSSEATSSERFAQNIFKALADMKALFSS